MDLLQVLTAVAFFVVAIYVLSLAFNKAFPLPDTDEESDESAPFW